jgi:hypothetical protein
MTKMKKRILIIAITCSVVFVCGGLILAYPLYYNSTFFRVNYYEKNWNIDLPRPIKLDFRASQTYIDGSAEYLVFTCEQNPAEDLFLKTSLNIKDSDFEKWLTDAASGIRSLSGESKIPDNYTVNFDTAYKYLCLESKGGLRFSYLYLMFCPDTMRIIICREVAQYQHLIK